MKELLIINILLLGTLVPAQARVQSLEQVHISQIAVGEKADSIDSVTQEAIKHAIEDNHPDWKLESLRESKESSSSTFTWASGELKMVAYVSYLSSPEEAAKQIGFNLATIQIPRYKPLAHVGSEAYLIKNEGPIMFRKTNIVVTVCGCEAPLEIVEQFARRIADSVAAR